jgi:carbon monoxide dehydrogenase subunit G
LELTGEQLIAAPRQRVWESLNDPQILSQCIPGCEQVVRLSETRFEAKVLTRLGPLRARFSGSVEMSDIKPPASCLLLFEGGAGSVGMAHGQSRVTLEDEGGGTRLRYAAEAAIGGKLGQIGGRLIDASVKKLADDFFSSLNDHLNAGEALAPAGEARLALAEAAPEVATSGAGPAATPVFGYGWTGEFQRLFWFALGAGLGAVIARLLPF